MSCKWNLHLRSARTCTLRVRGKQKVSVQSFSIYSIESGKIISWQTSRTKTSWLVCTGNEKRTRTDPELAPNYRTTLFSVYYNRTQFLFNMWIILMTYDPNIRSLSNIHKTSLPSISTVASKFHCTICNCWTFRWRTWRREKGDVNDMWHILPSFNFRFSAFRNAIKLSVNQRWFVLSTCGTGKDQL